MIKIEPLFATDYAQARALMRLEPAPAAGHPVSRRSLFLRGLAFWQHWLPAQLHVAPSVYVAKEDGVVLGLIVLRSTGKSRLCWQVYHLIVHPHHRGRGIAQELLRYVFALFGGQGASHFVAEVSDLNAAALSLTAPAASGAAPRWCTISSRSRARTAAPGPGRRRLSAWPDRATGRRFSSSTRSPCRPTSA